MTTHEMPGAIEAHCYPITPEEWARMELKVWDKDEYGSYEGYYEYEHDDLDAESHVHSKRFTDAELGAEVWRARYSEVAYELPVIPQEYLDRVDTVERFATLPHYDEALS